MTDTAKRRLLQPTCNCEHWAAMARKHGSVTFICPVHGCATLDARPAPAAIPSPVKRTGGMVDARSTYAIKRPDPTSPIKW